MDARLSSVPFEQAVAVARSLGLASENEWRAWCKEGMSHPNVPTAPDKTDMDGEWQGWSHWLDTGNAPGGQLVHDFRPFEFKEALTVARSLWLASKKVARVVQGSPATSAF